MHRIEWRLLHPIRDGCRDRVEALTAELGELDGTRPVLAVPDPGLVDHLTTELARLTVSPCEAAGAPILEDSPDWERRLLVEFHEDDQSTDAIDFDDYVTQRRGDPDCERCPYSTPYTLFPLNPCEFAAGALLDVLDDESVLDRVVEEMEPPEMIGLATELEVVRDEGRFLAAESVDSHDYLSKAALFLRFWAGLGFSVAPFGPDEDASATDEDELDIDDLLDDLRKGSAGEDES